MAAWSTVTDVTATQHRLTPPLTEPQVRGLRVGDSVTLDGSVYGLRDATLIRMFDQGVAPPVDLAGAVVLHTAPNVARGPDGSYRPLSVGTTTSMRMDRFTRPLLERWGVRAIIGKGGLSRESLAAFGERGAVYLAITGGAAALETTQIEAIEGVWWEDLLPECLWRFRVRGLGPLIVAMDAQGGDLYAEVLAEARSRLDGIYAKLGL
ncbi:MAG: fumarate hydratase C-terminal domain-containing protein [Candidatus Rokubacteria bacterium]|nr:fumarate hydratase C-terminal domain-containing protein [Candidatus Rokubacteria bacterium]